MGVPLFQVRDRVREHGIAVCSSNYALYGDFSERVLGTLKEAAPAVEVYSIDEAFLDLTGMDGVDLEDWSRELRTRIRRWTGVLVSIGLGPTKTLAKIANRRAKREASARGVCDLAGSPDRIEAMLRETEVGDVWGIGHRWARKLTGRGFRTAFDLACAPDGWVRKNLGVVGHRTVLELRGRVCLELETQPVPRQTVRHSRTFARAVRDPDQLRAAVASLASSAAAKVRSYGLEAGAVQVFVLSDRFASSGPRHSGSWSPSEGKVSSIGRPGRC